MKNIFKEENKRNLPNQRISLHNEIMAGFPTIDKYAMIVPSDTLTRRNTRAVADISDDSSLLTNEAIYYLWPFLYESQFDYEYRLKSCTPFNLYKKIIGSIIGLATRKPALVADSEAKEGDDSPKWYDNINFSGCDVSDIVVRELLPKSMAGMGAIVVDYSKTLKRAYFSFYGPEQIAHVKYEFFDGIKKLTRIALISEEEYEEEDKEFECKTRKKALVYRLDTNGAEHRAYAEKYIDGEDEPTETYEIKNSAGKDFDEIPIALFYGRKVDDGIGEPPLYSAARKNLKHLNMESAYENGLTVANFPMIYLLSENAGGMTADGEPGTVDVKISPKSLWHIRDNNAKIGYLEFKGECLQITQEYISKVEDEIASMGINVIAEQKTNRTKAEYQGVQTTSTSLMQEIVSSDEQALNEAFGFAAKYENKEKTIEVTLNHDFIIDPADASVVNAIKDLWLERGISGETMIQSLVAYEILPKTTFLEEQKKIDNEGTMSGTEPFRGNIEPPEMYENERADDEQD